MSARLLGLGFGCDMGTPCRKLVLLKLIDACDDDGTRIFPAVATIARAAQCSARQVQRELSRFVDVGLLAIVREGGMGPGSTREYRLNVAMLRAIEAEGWDAVTTGAPNGKGDTVSPLDEGGKGDTGDTERVTPATDKGDTACHPTPPYPSKYPSGRAEAREREGSIEEDGKEDSTDKADVPGTAAFEKRVMRFCSGKGYLAGPWKDWDTSSPGWIARQFAALTAEERQEAERWRDAYLFDIAARGKTPTVVGNFFKGKVWTGLDPALLQRLEQRRSEHMAPDDRSLPDGWAASTGPVGMAWLFAGLLQGAPGGYRPKAGVWLENDLRLKWPSVHRWKAAQQTKGGTLFGEQWHALKQAMEAVPADSDVHAAWRTLFVERGWPWLSCFDGARVLWAPQGGPAGLSAFEAAILGEGQGDDGGRREAAE